MERALVIEDNANLLSNDMIVELFIENVTGNSLEFKEEDFDCFISTLHQYKRISDKQYYVLTFGDVIEFQIDKPDKTIVAYWGGTYNFGGEEKNTRIFNGIISRCTDKEDSYVVKENGLRFQIDLDMIIKIV